MPKKSQSHCVTDPITMAQMTSLQLPSMTSNVPTANCVVVAAAVSPQADSLSVTIDVGEPACGPESLDTCASEMSFCDLAESVALSDSVSRLVSPRNVVCGNFDHLHAMLLPTDDAYETWKQDCERIEAVARERHEHNNLVQMLLQQHAERETSAAGSNGEQASDNKGNLGMQHLVQSVRNIERSVANLHLHFGTAFPPNRRQNDSLSSVLQQSALTADMQQPFHCNNNINAPNMNQQHATGGRGRGRRHAQVN